MGKWKATGLHDSEHGRIEGGNSVYHLRLGKEDGEVAEREHVTCTVTTKNRRVIEQYYDRGVVGRGKKGP